MRLGRKLFFLLAFVYLLIAVSTSLLGWKNYPDTTWMVQVAQRLPTLRPWFFVRTEVLAPPFGTSVNYPPLFFMVIYPYTLLGRLYGWSDIAISNLYSIPLFLSDIACVYLVLEQIRLFRPKLSASVVKQIAVLLFFSGYFLYSSGFMGHPETLVVLFSLLGIRWLRFRRYGLSGCSFGLALITKPTAAMILIPVILALVSGKVLLRQIKRFGLGVALTFLVIALPFLIAYPRENFYDMFGVNQYLIIRGANVWWLVDAVTRRIFSINSLTNFYISVANPMLFSIIMLVLIVLFRRTRITIDKPNLFGVIALSQLTFTIFSKWLGFYHLLAGYVFIVLWDTIRNNAFPAFAMIYACLLLVANFLDIPYWQIAVLLINTWGFIYVYSSLMTEGAKGKS